MTKQELTELVQDAQNAGAGWCNCCTSWHEADKERAEVVEKIWKELERKVKK